MAGLGHESPVSCGKPWQRRDGGRTGTRVTCVLRETLATAGWWQDWDTCHLSPAGNLGNGGTVAGLGHESPVSCGKPWQRRDGGRTGTRVTCVLRETLATAGWWQDWDTCHLGPAGNLGNGGTVAGLGHVSPVSCETYRPLSIYSRKQGHNSSVSVKEDSKLGQLLHHRSKGWGETKCNSSNAYLLSSTARLGVYSRHLSEFYTLGSGVVVVIVGDKVEWSYTESIKFVLV